MKLLRRFWLGILAASLIGLAPASSQTVSYSFGTSAFYNTGTSGANVPLLNGANTWSGNQTVSSSSFGLSGNISAPAWTTAGIRYANVAATLTDTTSSGTVAAARTDNFGGSTIAASSATTFTQYYTAYFNNPTAGSNVNFTNKSALGADSISIGGANQGTNALAVTGTSQINVGTNQNLVVNSVSSTLRMTALNDALSSNVNWRFQAAQFDFYGQGASTDLMSLQSGGVLWYGNTATTFPATATLQQGSSDAAAPVAQFTRVQSVVAGTTDTAGQDWTFQTSRGTGIGISGNFVFQGAPHSTTGSTQNAYATILTLNGDTKAATFNGNLLFGTDNSFDIGASAATRPRNIYAAGSITVSTGSFFGIQSSTIFRDRSNGVMTISNFAETDFGRLQFGGTTSSFPAIKRSAATLAFRLADDSTDAAITASGATFSGLTTGTNADTVCLSSGGVLLIQAAACTISSKRFKNLLPDFKGDALTELDKLPIAQFTMKTKNVDPNGNAVQLGLYAEDVAKVEPRCAIYEKDMKTPKSYRQECVIALLVKGEQQLVAENTSLKSRLAKLEASNDNHLRQGKTR